MITVTINGIDYKLPIANLNNLINWLQNNGATKVVESNASDPKGRSLINE